MIRDPKGRETRFTFDEHGRPLTRRLPSGETEEFRYNSFGQQILHISFEGVVTESLYDNSAGAGGRLTAKWFFPSVAAWNNGQGTPTETVSYLYDGLGRRFQILDPRGTTQYVYDTENRMIRIASPEGIVNYEYDSATGHRTRRGIQKHSD